MCGLLLIKVRGGSGDMDLSGKRVLFVVKGVVMGSLVILEKIWFFKFIGGNILFVSFLLGFRVWGRII